MAFRIVILLAFAVANAAFITVAVAFITVFGGYQFGDEGLMIQYFKSSSVIRASV